MNKRILALDLGTQTGWALLLSDTITSGTESFKPRKSEGEGMRYLRFRAWLHKIVFQARDLDAVYFEMVRRHTGTDAAHVYGGLWATLLTYCEQNEIPYVGVPVGTIKKFSTGKGNAPKETVIASVKERGFKPVDHNAADALAILYYARNTC